LIAEILMPPILFIYGYFRRLIASPIRYFAASPPPPPLQFAA